MRFLLGLLCGGSLAWLVLGIDWAPSIFRRCSHEVLSEAVSGSRVAVVYVSNCGAISPFVTSVAFRHEELPFDPDDSRGPIFSILARGGVEVRWPAHILNADDTPIVIAYPAGAKIIRQAIRWHGYAAFYEPR